MSTVFMDANVYEVVFQRMRRVKGFLPNSPLHTESASQGSVAVVINVITGR